MWVQKHNVYLLLLTTVSILMVFVLTFLLLQEMKLILTILLITSLISFAYVVPVFGKSLREIPYFKSPIIAFVWVVILFIFPALNEGISFSQIFPDLTAYFFFIIALTIPFDIRDLKYDDPKQKTLPMVFGINGSKVLALLIVIGFYVYFASFNENMSYNILFILANVCVILLIIFSSNKRKDVFFALVDATMILVGLSYFFG